jgi:hypothetical protein
MLLITEFKFFSVNRNVIQFRVISEVIKKLQIN